MKAVALVVEKLQLPVGELRRLIEVKGGNLSAAPHLENCKHDTGSG